MQSKFKCPVVPPAQWNELNALAKLATIGIIRYCELRRATHVNCALIADFGRLNKRQTLYTGVPHSMILISPYLIPFPTRSLVAQTECTRLLSHSYHERTCCDFGLRFFNQTALRVYVSLSLDRGSWLQLQIVISRYSLYTINTTIVCIYYMLM